MSGGGNIWVGGRASSSSLLAEFQSRNLNITMSLVTGNYSLQTDFRSIGIDINVGDKTGIQM